MPTFNPPLELVALRDTALNTLGTLTKPGSKTPTGLIFKISELFHDEHRFFNSEIVAASFQSAIKNAASALHTVNGDADVVTTAKDITYEDLHGYCGGIHDATTGQAFASYWHTMHLLNPHVPVAVDLSGQEIATHMGPTIDLF
jgi:hypothetical protein